MGRYNQFIALALFISCLVACDQQLKFGAGKVFNSETTDTLKAYQPALAVRGIACLMCHADVQSSIITDFGFGQPFFMGGGGEFDKGQSWYGNVASTWQTATRIAGSIIVPIGAAPANAMALLAPNTPAMSIQEFMLAPYVPLWNYDGNSAAQAMAVKVSPTVPNAKQVINKGSVVIRAPTDSEIRKLSPAFFADPAGVGFQLVNGNRNLELIVKDNGNGKFVMNDETQILHCANSDVLVNGNLYLRALKVDATAGCRFYVTGSVFIEDAITYLNMAGGSNLQITSSRAIVMGINTTRLNHRLTEDSRGLLLRDFDFPVLASQVVKDAAIIGTLRDAQDDYGGTRASIDYTGLLLNAPIINSRYLGSVKGVVIGEAALFALGAFHFQFDTVFMDTLILPLLTTPVLSVSTE